MHGLVHQYHIVSSYKKLYPPHQLVSVSHQDVLFCSCHHALVLRIMNN